jgi:hypothetical protein
MGNLEILLQPLGTVISFVCVWAVLNLFNIDFGCITKGDSVTVYYNTTTKCSPNGILDDKFYETLNY